MLPQMDVPLEIFLIINLINDVVLLFDYILIVCNQNSLTAIVRQHPWIGILLTLWECLFPITLYFHFFIKLT